MTENNSLPRYNNENFIGSAVLATPCIRERLSRMKLKVITITIVVAWFGLQWPIGFAKGYAVKYRAICSYIGDSAVRFKYTAGGILRGEKSSGTLQSSWYVDGLQQGMLFSLKNNCYTGKP